MSRPEIGYSRAAWVQRLDDADRAVIAASLESMLAWGYPTADRLPSGPYIFGRWDGIGSGAATCPRAWLVTASGDVIAGCKAVRL